MAPQKPVVEYAENADERVIRYRHEDYVVEIAKSTQGYGMLVVRTPSSGELERYYGLDMAVDHAAEVLGVRPETLDTPTGAEDIGI